VNHTQAAVLVRYVRALCPQQKFDEYSADAWHDLLGEYDFDACKEAARQLGQRQPFIAPAEIITEVRKGRAKRLENFVYEPDPDETPGEYLRRLRAQIADVAEGRREPQILTGSPDDRLVELLPGVGQRIPPKDSE
jgi:hypothetical protein